MRGETPVGAAEPQDGLSPHGDVRAAHVQPSTARLRPPPALALTDGQEGCIARHRFLDERARPVPGEDLRGDDRPRARATAASSRPGAGAPLCTSDDRAGGGGIRGCRALLTVNQVLLPFGASSPRYAIGTPWPSTSRVTVGTTSAVSGRGWGRFTCTRVMAAAPSTAVPPVGRSVPVAGTGSRTAPTVTSPVTVRVTWQPNESQPGATGKPLPLQGRRHSGSNVRIEFGTGGWWRPTRRVRVHCARSSLCALPRPDRAGRAPSAQPGKRE